MRRKSLCLCGDNLILLYDLERAVNIVDMSGTLLSTVYKDNDNDPLLKSPRYINLNRSLDVLHITDWNANTVTAMTLEGHVVSVYKHNKLDGPRGVAVGQDDSVYVCSYASHTVHQLSTNGQHVKILLDQQRGLATYPHAIAFDEDNNRLCISSASKRSEDKNFVKMFQLE